MEMPSRACYNQIICTYDRVMVFHSKQVMAYSAQDFRHDMQAYIISEQVVNVID